MQGYSDLVRVGGRVKGGVDIDAFLLTMATDVQKFLHSNSCVTVLDCSLKAMIVGWIKL